MTVMVSRCEASSISTFTVAVKPSVTRTLSWTTFAKPCSSNVILYSPGVTAANRYCPCSLVTSLRVPIIAGLEITTVTPGSTALVLSVTVPFIAPVVALVVWPAASDANVRTQSHPNTAERRSMGLTSVVRNARSRAGRGLLLRPGGCRLLGQILVVDGVLDIRLVHLVPTLLGPEHFLLGRRVVLVLGGVVVVARRDDLAAGRDLQRLLQVVVQLPVEVVLRHAQDRLLLSVRIDDDVLHVLAAQVHVRRETVERDRLGHRGDRGDRPVLRVGRDVRDLRPAPRHAVHGDRLARRLAPFDDAHPLEAAADHLGDH